MVFHTAPPHPASNARITCSPQLVGGALANQNGFGHRMPAKFVVRSANAYPSHEPVILSGVACSPIASYAVEGPAYCSNYHRPADLSHEEAPPRAAAIPCAARLPSATASTTSRPPFAQSPPAKYLGLVVCPVVRWMTTRPCSIATPRKATNVGPTPATYYVINFVSDLSHDE